MGYSKWPGPGDWASSSGVCHTKFKQTQAEIIVLMMAIPLKEIGQLALFQATHICTYIYIYIIHINLYLYNYTYIYIHISKRKFEETGGSFS